MKKLLLLLCCAAFVLTGTEIIPLLKQAPRMSGKPGDPAWRDALELTDFKFNPNFKMSSLARKPRKTTAWLGRTPDTLYAAVLAEHPYADQHTDNQKVRDGMVFQDDEFEIFFDFQGKRRSYLQIISNVSGILYDHFVDSNGRYKLNWDSGAYAKGSFQNNSYYIEIAVPFASLRLGENETGTVGIALARCISCDKDCRSVLGGFHAPLTWTHFQKPFCSPVVLEKAEGDFVGGEREFTFALKNCSKEKITLTGTFNGKAVTPITLAPQSSGTLKTKTQFVAGEEKMSELQLYSGKKEVMRWNRFRKIDKLMDFYARSPIFYQGEKLRFGVRLGGGKLDPITIEFLNAQGKVLKTLERKPRKAAFDLTLAHVQGACKIRASFRGETLELPYKVITSPWRKNK